MNKRKPPKLVAAMSGGVDSSVAAAIYREKGCEVIGITLQFYSCNDPTGKKRVSCNMEDNIQVRKIADKLGIPHHFLDVSREFKEMVLEKAWLEYNRARTPNPCVWCNRHFKFGVLLNYALNIGAEGIITGHYARIIKQKNGNCILIRGLDAEKDQSYFLFGLTQEQMRKSYLPLGEMTKYEVREKARQIGLPNAEKTESQDACLGTKNENFSETLRKLFNANAKPGFIIDPQGNKLGTHDGIHLFTIGQRRSLGISLGAPAYVSAIDYDTGNVVVSKDKNDLFSDSLTAAALNWQIAEFANTRFKCQAQIRYRHKAVPAEVIPISEGKVTVKFDKPQRAVTPGQAVVFYEEEKLIGGGWIENRLPARRGGREACPTFTT